MPYQPRIPIHKKHGKQMFGMQSSTTLMQKFIIVICVLVILLSIAVIVYTLYINRSITINRLNKEQLGINSALQDEKYADVTNIALFGLDRRGGKGNSRSDAIIVLTIDRKRSKMKATSLLRDCYVDIDGRKSREKLGHAYAYGGPELAVRTINQNFNLNVEDYVTIDFDSMAKIVDAVGGVTIDVKKNELPSANNSIQEYCEAYKIKKVTPIKQAGVQQLNGMQACGYARVRNVGGDDRQRTDRQRRVMEEVFKKVLEMGTDQLPSLAAKIAPLVETSLSLTDMLGLGTKVMESEDAQFEQARFPMNEDLHETTANGSYVLDFNREATNKKIHDFLFDDIHPEQSENTSSQTVSQ